jgi:hypothetical protein
MVEKSNQKHINIRNAIIWEELIKVACHPERKEWYEEVISEFDDIFL